jgi:hypothetical protein
MPDLPPEPGRSKPPGADPEEADHAGAVETLRYDVAARRAIDLATGILMEQRGIDAEEARALLEHLTDRLIEDDDAEPDVTGAEPDRVVDELPLGAVSRQPLTS